VFFKTSPETKIILDVLLTSSHCARTLRFDVVQLSFGICTVVLVRNFTIEGSWCKSSFRNLCIITSCKTRQENVARLSAVGYSLVCSCFRYGRMFSADNLCSVNRAPGFLGVFCFRAVLRPMRLPNFFQITGLLHIVLVHHGHFICY